jgi:lysozyme
MRAFCAAFLALACAAPPEPASQSPAVAPPTPLRVTRAEVAARLDTGIDVSNHSGAVDWKQVRDAGYTFGIAKASEGVDNPDRAFADHWAGMKEAGLIRGAYHFYVTEDDPREQAALFISRVTLEPGDLAPILDVELIGHGTQEEGLPARVETWLEVIEEHFGIRPMIYTDLGFWNQHFGAEAEKLASYPLWLAEYNASEPTLPLGWKTWHLWQWSGDATVPGVEKTADLSRVNRSLDRSGLVFVPTPKTDTPARGPSAGTPGAWDRLRSSAAGPRRGRPRCARSAWPRSPRPRRAAARG